MMRYFIDNLHYEKLSFTDGQNAVRTASWGNRQCCSNFYHFNHRLGMSLHKSKQDSDGPALEPLDSIL